MEHPRLKTTAVGIILAVLAAACWADLSARTVDAFGPPPGASDGFAGAPPDGPPGRAGRPARGLIVLAGRDVFFDVDLSNPSGMACASCHAPETGFSYPLSRINQIFGPVPGVISNRFGSRKPMTISYSWFVPRGPTFFSRRRAAWVGGLFADGRADDFVDQFRGPMTNPNEMNNVLHELASPAMVVSKVAGSSYAGLFRQVFGADVFAEPVDDVFEKIGRALSAFESSPEVSPFSSRYDAYVEGRARLTPAELDGLRLFTGSLTGRPDGPAYYKNAQCSSCHLLADSDQPRRDFFTNWAFANIGVPKNPRNPYYAQTNPALDPSGFNPDGNRFVDLGLGAVLYPRRGLPPGNTGPDADGRGDFLQADGVFRVPSLRNVDQRPNPYFVKCYMHNGFFKTLRDVVHFYNTRNLTTRGEIIDFTGANPYANLKGQPLWPRPEYASPVTLQNPAGRPAGPSSRIGNLGLSAQDEQDIVAFLGTLTDGYFTPARRRPPPNG